MRLLELMRLMSRCGMRLLQQMQLLKQIRDVAIGEDVKMPLLERMWVKAAKSSQQRPKVAKSTSGGPTVAKTTQKDQGDQKQLTTTKEQKGHH